jgi:hypothetical protein
VVNATLRVGSTTQQVTVQATPAQINTTSMQLGFTITGKSIVDLPLNGRDWIQLQQLQPGVVGEADSRFTDAYSTNGAEAQQNSFLLNGVDIGDIALNVPDITIPSPDAIGEFRMITNTINPEYGRNSGAIMNAVIKAAPTRFTVTGLTFSGKHHSMRAASSSRALHRSTKISLAAPWGARFVPTHLQWQGQDLFLLFLPRPQKHTARNNY